MSIFNSNSRSSGRVKRLARSITVAALLVGGLLGTAAAADAAPDLAKFAGTYKMPEMVNDKNAPGFKILQDGNSLRAKTPDSPGNPLRPLGDNRYAIENMPDGFVVEFIVENGVVTGLKLSQGGPDPLTLKRVAE